MPETKKHLTNIIRKYTEVIVLFIAALFGQSSNTYGQKDITKDTATVNKLTRTILDSPLMSGQRTADIGKEIVAFSTKEDYQEGIVKGIIIMAAGYAQMGDNKDAIENYLKAIAICQEKKYYNRCGRAFSGLGKVYQSLGMNDKAFESNTSALEMFEKIKDTVLIANAYTFIGESLVGMNKYEDAIKYYSYSLGLNKTRNDKRSIIFNYYDIGSACMYLKKYPEAFRYLYEAEHWANELGDPSLVPWLNIGSCYQATGKFDSALFYYKKDLEVALAMDDKGEQCNAYISLGETYLQLREINEAEAYSKKGLEIAKKNFIIQSVLAASESLAKIYVYKHDFEQAFKYEVQAFEANDSIVSRQKELVSSEMEVRFRVKELNDQNILLKKDNDNKQVRLQRKNIIGYSGFGAALLFLVIGMLIVQQNRYKANQQKLELEQKQLLAQINPHFIFNCLNSIQQFVVQNDTINANRYLADFALLMRQTLDNSKDGNISLRREIEYLENYLSFEHMRFEDKFAYTVQFTPDMNIDTIEIPSMIIQPFVENAIRHGLINLETRKGLLNISFYKKEDFLYCEIDDNGIGMEEAQRLKGQTFIKYQSHGMELTRQRLALVSKLHSKDYVINIINKTGQDQNPGGTTIIIKFPLQA